MEKTKDTNEVRKAFIIFCLVGMISTIIFLVYTRGEGLNKIFFRDSMDTGMDFFHSIEYINGNAPYEKFGTLYPPLANLFFAVLFMFVPQWQYVNWGKTFEEGIALRGSRVDLRVWQPTMILFILFITVTSIAFYMIVQICLKNIKRNKLISVLLVFSYPIVYALERGNIILISVFLCMFYLIYFDTSNKLLKEVALIALALSAGLKIYPAIFGMLLIYNRQWKEALRTVVYGVMSFILPFFVFKEKLSGLFIFIHQLSDFGKITELTCSGTSFDRMLNSDIYIISKFLSVSLDGEQVIKYTCVFNYIIVVILLLSGVILKERWKQVLICALSIILLSSQGIYILSFILCPMVYFIKEVMILNRENFVYLLGMVGLIIFLPLAVETDAIIVPQYVRIHIFMWILLIAIVFNVFCVIRKRLLLRRSNRAVKI